MSETDTDARLDGLCEEIADTCLEGGHPNIETWIDQGTMRPLIATALRTARAEGMGAAALAVRAACGACDNGTAGYDEFNNAVECEYCGRPMAAIRAAGEENHAG